MRLAFLGGHRVATFVDKGERQTSERRADFPNIGRGAYHVARKFGRVATRCWFYGTGLAGGKILPSCDAADTFRCPTRRK